jgi:dipeptidyl aminopeptidase/acylaminoacyl peptidase
MRVLALSVAFLVIPVVTASGQSVPGAIVAEGVPAVPTELVRALERYQNTRPASFQGWFADRREVLISTRFADTSQIHKVAFPGGDRSQLTFLPERVLGARTRPGREAFAFIADEGGAENYQGFELDPKDGSVTRLTDGKSRNVLADWSNSGNLLAYSSNARNGKDMDIYILDRSSGAPARRLKEVSGDWEVADWSPDDRNVAAVERISINESHVFLIDVGTGQTEPVTPPGAVAYEDVQFSKDGRSLYWTTDAGSEFRRLAKFDLSSKASTVLSGETPWDVEAFDLSDDGTVIVYSANEDGYSRLHALDTATGRERTPAPAVPSGVISSPKFRKGSHEFAFTLTSAREIGNVYSYDLDSGVLTRWTSGETGGLNTSALAEPALVRFPTFDGRQVPAFVYRPGPKFSGKRPVVINIHGGPEGQSRPGFLGRSNYLIDGLGAALVVPNVRGSSGYGKTYLNLDNGKLREDSVKDIGALLDWVEKQPDLDASRVAVMGGSYGGYMTLASLTHYSDRLRAGIDVVGISSFITMLESTSAYRRDLRRVEYGDEREPSMREHLMKISPLTNASKIHVPLLVVAGKNDPRVPVTESEQIAAAVRKGERPVWYIVAKNEGHGFARKENQDYLQYAEVLFLQRFLINDGSGS